MAGVSEEDVRSCLLPAELLSQTQTGAGGPGRVGEGYTEAGLGLTQHYYGTGWGCRLVGGLRECDGHLLVPAVLLVTECKSQQLIMCKRVGCPSQKEAGCKVLGQQPGLLLLLVLSSC